MVWYFIGVYIINRTLHGRLEIRISLLVLKKIFHSFNTEEKFRISARPCNILYLLQTYLVRGTLARTVQLRKQDKSGQISIK